MAGEIILRSGGSGCVQPIVTWWREIRQRNVLMACVLGLDGAADNGVAIWRAKWSDVEYPGNVDIHCYRKGTGAWISLEEMIAAGLTDRDFYLEAYEALKPTEINGEKNYLLGADGHSGTVIGACLPRLGAYTALRREKKCLRLTPNLRLALLISRAWVTAAAVEYEQPARVRHAWRVKGSLPGCCTGMVGWSVQSQYRDTTGSQYYTQGGQNFKMEDYGKPCIDERFYAPAAEDVTEIDTDNDLYAHDGFTATYDSQAVIPACVTANGNRYLMKSDGCFYGQIPSGTLFEIFNYLPSECYNGWIQRVRNIPWGTIPAEKAEAFFRNSDILNNQSKVEEAWSMLSGEYRAGARMQGTRLRRLTLKNGSLDGCVLASPVVYHSLGGRLTVDYADGTQVTHKCAIWMSDGIASDLLAIFYEALYLDAFFLDGAEGEGTIALEVRIDIPAVFTGALQQTIRVQAQAQGGETPLILKDPQTGDRYEADANGYFEIPTSAIAGEDPSPGAHTKTFHLVLDYTEADFKSYDRVYSPPQAILFDESWSESNDAESDILVSY